MTPTPRQMLPLRTLLVINLFAASALAIGCGPEGAGSIHIDSPKAKKKLMQTGAGLAPAGIAKPGPLGRSQKSVPSSVNKNHVPKNG
jgi:hypothetical protein